ncbi:hypothetical protein Tsubulata_042654 [Turnera subulata]|uniref:Uncharacterized protein n=1 Tax=Turnera subulata TaxID=218843 RepID=A0A9Q0FXQ2_9ROSI|nr:hypothetical protein Tsubulata_042654 [Turnera subulata]
MACLYIFISVLEEQNQTQSRGFSSSVSTLLYSFNMKLLLLLLPGAMFQIRSDEAILAAACSDIRMWDGLQNFKAGRLHQELQTFYDYWCINIPAADDVHVED